MAEISGKWITQLPNTETITADTSFIVDDGTNTQSIKADDLAEALLAILPPDSLMSVIKGELALEMHRNIFRGKNLGSSVGEIQKAAIRDGSFTDLYIGDYWVINGVTWRIADINYWMQCGNANFTTPHLVIMPDTSLYTAQMNETDTTDGGYVGSLMYTANLENAKTTITDIFGDMVLTRRELLTNAVTDGYPIGTAWYDSAVELPSETMLYGSYIQTPAGGGSVAFGVTTISKSQLALFKLAPRFIHNRQSIWLRDVVSAKYFAFVDVYGIANCNNASKSCGVRPVFAIG